MKVCIVSLGCPKNLVDSEVMAGHLAREGLDLVLQPEGADAVVVNTCGFVDSAKEESRATVSEMCRLKAEGRLRAVVVAGCLVQRFKRALEGALPEVDAFLPISDYSGLPAVLRAVSGGGRGAGPVPYPAGGRPRSSETDLGRLLLTCPHVSYLRIAEGCNHQCAFCAIPAIRGRLRSKPPDLLVEEAEGLAALGVKEINLVAEDTTDYGRDLEGKALLPLLLRRLGKVRGIRWIRVLYAYPSRVTGELVKEMARNPKVVEYLDMPVQHISTRLLKSMRRGTSPSLIRRVIRELREGILGVALRTSVIVGYPGEGEADFKALLDFIGETRFERLGAFLFSPEEGTAGANLSDPVPPHVAEARLGELMALQQTIHRERNNALVGTDEEVIVDAVQENGFAVGRTRADAPEIDGVVNITFRRSVRPGAILKVRITGVDGYDLLGNPANEVRKGGR